MDYSERAGRRQQTSYLLSLLKAFLN